MSGFKRASVTISPEEYQRLHNADMELRFYKNQPVADNSSHQMANEFQKKLIELQNRQNNFDIVLGNLETGISEVEMETQQKIFNTQTTMYENLLSRIEKQGNILDCLGTTLVDIEDHVAKELEVNNYHYQVVTSQLEYLFDRESGKNQIVYSWLTTTSEICRYIIEQYDHEKFLPGQLVTIYNQVRIAEDNFNRGMAEAALPIIQQSYLDLTNMRVELERKTTEWQSLFLVSWEAANQLFKRIKKNATIPALDANGDEMNVQLMLNFWSGGEYLQLQNRTRSIIMDMKERVNVISIHDLQNIISNSLPEIVQQFDNLIYQARYAALNSQFRINIAEMAIFALRSQGFVEQSCGYDKEDMRNSYFVKMENIEGSQVTIWINPIDNEKNLNDIVVQSSDVDVRSEPELRNRANEILNSLKNRGLVIKNLETNPTPQLPLSANFRSNDFRQLKNQLHHTR